MQSTEWTYLISVLKMESNCTP